MPVMHSYFIFIVNWGSDKHPSTIIKLMKHSVILQLPTKIIGKGGFSYC